MSKEKPYSGEDFSELDDDTQGKRKRRVFTPEERAFRRRVGLEIEGETEEAQRERLAPLRARLAEKFDFDPPLQGLEGEDLQAFERAQQGVQKMLDYACKGDWQAVEELMAPIRARLAEKFDLYPLLEGDNLRATEQAVQDLEDLPPEAELKAEFRRALGLKVEAKELEFDGQGDFDPNSENERRLRQWLRDELATKKNEEEGEQLREELESLIKNVKKRHSNAVELDWKEFDRKLWTEIQKRGLLPCSPDVGSRDEEKIDEPEGEDLQAFEEAKRAVQEMVDEDGGPDPELLRDFELMKRLVKLVPSLLNEAGVPDPEKINKFREANPLKVMRSMTEDASIKIPKSVDEEIDFKVDDDSELDKLLRDRDTWRYRRGLDRLRKAISEEKKQDYHHEGNDVGLDDLSPAERAFRRHVGLEIEGETEEDQRKRLAALRAEIVAECEHLPLPPLSEEDILTLDAYELGAIQADVRDNLRRKISDAELDELLRHPSVQAELALSEDQRADRDERRRRKRDELLNLGAALLDEDGMPDQEKIDAYFAARQLAAKKNEENDD